MNDENSKSADSPVMDARLKRLGAHDVPPGIDNHFSARSTRAAVISMMKETQANLALKSTLKAMSVRWEDFLGRYSAEAYELANYQSHARRLFGFDNDDHSRSGVLRLRIRTKVADLMKQILCHSSLNVIRNCIAFSNCKNARVTEFVADYGEFQEEEISRVQSVIHCSIRQLAGTVASFTLPAACVIAVQGNDINYWVNPFYRSEGSWRSRDNIRRVCEVCGVSSDERDTMLNALALHKQQLANFFSYIPPDLSIRIHLSGDAS